ncbi:MAG: hypothetical protein M0Q92_11130, partial [Methanoregula sp.]|nr:hypothetical protein [Methanoregula sp.]
MPNIDDFTLKDMVDFSAAFRKMGTDAASMDVVADRIVHYLYENLVDKKTGAKGCALVRFFKTYPYGNLDPELQESARSVLKGSSA